MNHVSNVEASAPSDKETLSVADWVRLVLRDAGEDDVLGLFESDRYLQISSRRDVVRVRGRRAGFDTGPGLLPRIGPAVDVDSVLQAHSKTASGARREALTRLAADLDPDGGNWHPPSPRGTADLLRRQIYATVSLDLCDWFGMSATARRAAFAAQLGHTGRTRRSVNLSRQSDLEIARRAARLRRIEQKAVPVTYRLVGTPLVDAPQCLEDGRMIAPGDTFTTSVLTLVLEDWLESGRIEPVAAGQLATVDRSLDEANRKVLDDLSALCARQREVAESEAQRRRARGANARSDTDEDRSAQRTTQRLQVDGRALLAGLGVWPWACFPAGRLPGPRRMDWRTVDRTAEEALLEWLRIRST